MTKKQFAITAAVELGLPEFSTIRRVIDAIIDALPEEAQPSWRVWGPEPKYERTTRPTSAFPQQPIVTEPNGIRHFKENTMIRYILKRSTENMNTLADAPFTNEERRQFAQLIGYTVDGYNELSYVEDADLGQRPDPPATSPAQPQIPEEGSPCLICGGCISPYDTYGVFALGRAHWNCVKREACTVGCVEKPNYVTDFRIITEEDARKLRIMKAMEDITSQNLAAGRAYPRFVFDGGKWSVDCVLGTTPVNDMYSPADPEEQRIDKEIAEVKANERPAWVNEIFERIAVQLDAMGKMWNAPKEPEAEKLWEGEAWVHPETTEVVQSGAHMSIRDGWRRIKVREVK